MFFLKPALNITLTLYNICTILAPMVYSNFNILAINLYSSSGSNIKKKLNQIHQKLFKKTNENDELSRKIKYFNIIQGVETVDNVFIEINR